MVHWFIVVSPSTTHPRPSYWHINKHMLHTDYKHCLDCSSSVALLIVWNLQYDWCFKVLIICIKHWTYLLTRVEIYIVLANAAGWHEVCRQQWQLACPLKKLPRRVKPWWWFGPTNYYWFELLAWGASSVVINWARSSAPSWRAALIDTMNFLGVGMVFMLFLPQWISMLVILRPRNKDDDSENPELKFCIT